MHMHMHMVECSSAMQKLQHQRLKCNDEDSIAAGVDKRSLSTAGGVFKRSLSTLTGTPVSWHATMEQVPT
ncbi:hypothetical protein V6N12_045001 [Hibiscus sabdariffa]|uniref:Uncharacterized protein n=1 Tax=Hibiscus sabdariffa TaxID=183260 RepID=A0ABR2G1P6_9ROSI